MLSNVNNLFISVWNLIGENLQTLTVSPLFQQQALPAVASSAFYLANFAFELFSSNYKSIIRLSHDTLLLRKNSHIVHYVVVQRLNYTFHKERLLDEMQKKEARLLTPAHFPKRRMEK